MNSTSRADVPVVRSPKWERRKEVLRAARAIVATQPGYDKIRQHDGGADRLCGDDVLDDAQPLVGQALDHGGDGHLHEKVRGVFSMVIQALSTATDRIPVIKHIGESGCAWLSASNRHSHAPRPCARVGVSIWRRWIAQADRLGGNFVVLQLASAAVFLPPTRGLRRRGWRGGEGGSRGRWQEAAVRRLR